MLAETACETPWKNAAGLARAHAGEHDLPCRIQHKVYTKLENVCSD
jgi:hypothetical protein